VIPLKNPPFLRAKSFSKIILKIVIQDARNRAILIVARCFDPSRNGDFPRTGVFQQNQMSDVSQEKTSKPYSPKSRMT
jgi:hypothetical protein